MRFLRHVSTRRVVLLSLFGGCVLALVLVVHHVETESNCEKQVIGRLPSPDAARTAVVTEFVCDLGLSSDVTDDLQVVSAAHPDQAVDILGVDTHGHDELRPRLAWSSPTVLRVTVPLLSYLTILTRHADGVRIDLHFDPEDPAARAAWLKKFDLPPDPPDDAAPR